MTKYSLILQSATKLLTRCYFAQLTNAWSKMFILYIDTPVNHTKAEPAILSPFSGIIRAS